MITFLPPSEWPWLAKALGKRRSGTAVNAADAAVLATASALPLAVLQTWRKYESPVPGLNAFAEAELARRGIE
jgi:hypothetical protein